MTEMIDKSTFIARLADEMERNGIDDRSALSRITGIKYHRLNPWFTRANAKPNASDLLTLARLFNVSENYLLNGGPREPYPRLNSLIERVESLDVEQQDELESYLDFLDQKAARKRSDPRRK